jgi:hypothetical protein
VIFWFQNLSFKFNLYRYHKGRHKHGGTDKGQEGIENFFRTHVCSPLCKRMGLKPFEAVRGRAR